PEEDRQKTRILALGNSHTMATGVSQHETWAKVLQAQLSKEHAKPYRVYNAGIGGYSLHQYLLRLIDQGPLVKPHYVIVGFTFASDLYDLLPPSKGGWVFFQGTPRTYFDFDEKGELREIVEKAPARDVA